MDHTYRHLSSGLDIDNAEDIFCDSSLIIILMMMCPKQSWLLSKAQVTHLYYVCVGTLFLLVVDKQDDTPAILSVSDNKPLTKPLV